MTPPSATTCTMPVPKIHLFGTLPAPLAPCGFRLPGQAAFPGAVAGSPAVCPHRLAAPQGGRGRAAAKSLPPSRPSSLKSPPLLQPQALHVLNKNFLPPSTLKSCQVPVKNPATSRKTQIFMSLFWHFFVMVDKQPGYAIITIRDEYR
jgi:hypothetical protein